jgi:glycosyltransferase involved in cell wall biosynthesis
MVRAWRDARRYATLTAALDASSEFPAPDALLGLPADPRVMLRHEAGGPLFVHFGPMRADEDRLDMLAALALYRRHDPAAKLLFVSREPAPRSAFRDLRRAAADWGLPRRAVVCVSRTTALEVKAYLLLADVCLTTTRPDEPVAAAARALSVPVVAVGPDPVANVDALRNAIAEGHDRVARPESSKGVHPTGDRAPRPSNTQGASRIAIVVQRCHPDIAGGSEVLAWSYARLLRDDHDVEILTTTAIDYHTWANVLPAGLERQCGIALRRFPITITRSVYWMRLHEQLLDFHAAWLAQHPGAAPLPNEFWRLAQDEEFIRCQGPYSAPLLAYLAEHADDYAAILCVTYLYPTSYFTIAHAPPGRCILVPTLHDEPTAYLRAYRDMAHRAGSILWLTEAERRLGERLWGNLPGRVVGMPIVAERVAPAQEPKPYLLYSGRIDPAKGCDRLIAWFRAWRSERRSSVRLILTGDDHLGVKPGGGIDYRGFVSEQEKLALMAGALAFVMPSACESFSIATLEAMGQGTPALVNSACPVLADHIARSGGGLAFHDAASFSTAVDRLVNDRRLGIVLGEKARAYVTKHYAETQLRAALRSFITPLPALPPLPRSCTPAGRLDG